MFVQDFEVVDHPYDQVLSCLSDCDGPESLLGAAFVGARSYGESLRAKVGPAGWPPAFAKAVEVGCGSLRHHGDGTLIPVTWQASGGPSLFPRLDADLEVAPLGPQQTQLVLRARYEPPGGALGRGLDRMLLHRVAESTVRAFLSAICGALERAVKAQGAA